MVIIHSLSSGFKNQVSGVGCQVSGERKVRAETQNLVWNIYLDRIYRIIRIYFGVVFFYPVHPVDPVRKWTVYAVKFLFD